MQNRYVGDVGDFGKHGLLRCLAGIEPQAEPRLRLGLIWYMMPDEVHGPDPQVVRRDGRHIGYLIPTTANLHEFGMCDLVLWNHLGHLVGHNLRCVHCIEQTHLYPEGTQFYRAQLAFNPGMRVPFKAQVRQTWWDGALRATGAANIVMMDPDNGISPTDTRMLREAGPKFAFLDDVRSLWERAQSLVVYHHTGRTRGVEQQARDAAELLGGALGLDERPMPLLFRRGSVRVFVVVPQPQCRELFGQRITEMLRGPWGRHFELIE